MGWKNFLLNTLVLTAFAGIPTFATAKVYPWIQVHQDNVRVISDPKVEAMVRLDMIHLAEESIDIITFDQRADEDVGGPLLNALINATHRGVRVRLLTAWGAGLLKDPFNRVERALKKAHPDYPIQFISVGGPAMWSRGWGYVDGIHEKLLIIDGRRQGNFQSGRLGMSTGRGNAGEYLRWMDTALVTTDDGLIDQMVEAFENTWTVVTQEYNSPKVRKFKDYAHILPPKVLPELDQVAPWEEEEKPTYPLSNPQINSIENHMDWLKTAPKRPEAANAQELLKIRTLHYEFLKDLRNYSKQHDVLPENVSYETRMEELRNPILEELMHLLAQPDTSELKLFTLSTKLVPRFKSALLHSLARGIGITFFTNSKACHSKIVPIRFPFGWYIGIADLDDLLQAGVQGVQLVTHKNDPNSAIFLHRKIAIVEGKNRHTVFIGSDNFNFSSSAESTELAFEIESENFTHQMNRLFQESWDQNAEVIDKHQLHKERKSTPTRQRIADTLRAFY